MAFREGKVTETAYWETESANGFRIVYWPTHQVKIEVRSTAVHAHANFDPEDADDLIAAIRDAVLQVRELGKERA